ncbi:putative bifunctional diguanylate cyclase/phosphodiesterase [Oxalobacteraceae bacterium A2-2]
MQIPKVLLVNDDPASLYALESLLLEAPQRDQYDLVTAASGQEALRQVLLLEFAVILLDVSMPGMNGFETAEAIHSHPRSAATPIIFITAHYADELNRLKAYQKGAADYLFTPVIPQILQAKVAVFVEMKRKNMELRRQSEELARLNQDLRVQRLQDLERINAELQLEVRERKLAEQRAHELATRDPLTNLINRRSLIQHLEHAVATSDRSGAPFALLFMDLNKFKQVNDQHGHETGDELLRQVAARLMASVRAADVVARLGGDEFVVLIEGRLAAANAAKVAHKIEQACALPFDINGQRVRSGASIGIALYPQDGADAQVLMKNADTAMYHAKQQHGVQEERHIQFFHQELNQRDRERERWTRELRAALSSGQLELRYQPQAALGGTPPGGAPTQGAAQEGAALAGAALAGAEAILHWRHPEHGLIAADRFLPLVQDRALLDRLDAWMIAAVCAQAAALRQAFPGLPAARLPCLWLDLHAAQLQEDVLRQLLPVLLRHKLGSGSIGLELGEDLLLGPADAVNPLLARLHQAGVQVALDHFGSARSSLAACKRLRIGVLKIEPGFVHAIGNDEGGTDMVAAVLHLARALKMRSVALGVHSAAQLDVLRRHGCDLYQGDLLGPALSPAALQELLRAQAQTSTFPDNEDTVHEQHE